MTTIAQLLIIAERELKEADINAPLAATINQRIARTHIEISQAASLLAIARSLNHIVDHGVGPGPLLVLSDEERENLDKSMGKSIDKE